MPNVIAPVCECCFRLWQGGSSAFLGCREQSHPQVAASDEGFVQGGEKAQAPLRAAIE